MANFKYTVSTFEKENGYWVEQNETAMMTMEEAIAYGEDLRAAGVEIGYNRYRILKGGAAGWAIVELENGELVEP